MENNIKPRPVGRPRKNPPKETDMTAPKPKQTRNRPDLANYGEEYVQPGDNTKYLSHALTISQLPLVDLNNIDEVEERINLYFRLCVQNDVKPTVTGFSNALNVHKDTIRSWRVGEFRANTHQAVIVRAYSILEELWEDYMMNGKINPVSGIFLGKNQWTGYSDKQELVLTPNQKDINDVDVATIEAKYAELPEGE